MPVWISVDVVRAIHAEVLTEHGGLPGRPRAGALEAALARPQNLLGYGNHQPSLSTLASSYEFGLARGHCFPDGNKRVALSTLDVFLQLNGYELTAGDTPATVDTFRALAAGQLSEEQLAEWISANSQPLPPD